ncbi:MAG: flagellar biosynthesis protein FliQ [Firmicutes bacterium]|nr:flagellar biosynthesis protein FliQ [Bacillota bacterium]
MSDTFVIALFREALTTVLIVAAPMLGVGLIVGLTISVLQATTQIHEQTLTFIPKILAVLLSMIFFGPWMLHTLISFFEKILGNLDQFTFIR